MRLTVLCFVALLAAAGPAMAASCGKTGAGFDKWKAAYADEAQAQGVGRKGLAALEKTSYSTATIKADRAQHSFKLTLDQFMEKRGAATIIAQGKKHKAKNAKLFAAIEKRLASLPVR
jgi:membrane-bound lytic murein transglycosylase B